MSNNKLSHQVRRLHTDETMEAEEGLSNNEQRTIEVEVEEGLSNNEEKTMELEELLDNGETMGFERLSNDQEKTMKLEELSNNEEETIKSEGLSNNEEEPINLKGLPRNKEEPIKLEGLSNNEEEPIKLEGLSNNEQEIMKLKGLFNNEEEAMKLEGLSNNEEEAMKLEGLSNNEDETMKLEGLSNNEEETVKVGSVAKNESIKRKAVNFEDEVGNGMESKTKWISFTPRTKQELESVRWRLFNRGLDSNEEFKGYNHFEGQLWEGFMATQTNVLYSIYKRMRRKELHNLFKNTNGVLPIGRGGLKIFLIYNKIFDCHHDANTGRHVTNHPSRSRPSSQVANDQMKKGEHAKGKGYNRAKTKVSVGSVKDLSGMPSSPLNTTRSRIIQTPHRYLDGQRTQRPTKRQSCSSTQLPLHKDKNVFQIGLLPPKYPRPLEKSPSSVLYPDPLPKPTSKKRGSKHQQALGGFFEISHLLQSGELEQAIAKHQFEEMYNQQRCLLSERSEPKLKQENKRLKQKYMEKGGVQDLPNESNLTVVQNLQHDTPSLFQQQTFVCHSGEAVNEVVMKGSPITPNANSNCIDFQLSEPSSKSQKEVVTATLPASLALLTPKYNASSGKHALSHLNRSLGLMREFVMRSPQQDAQSIRGTTVLPPMPKLTVPRKIHAFMKPEEQLIKRSRIPKVPQLTGKAFKNPVVTGTIIMQPRKLLQQNSKMRRFEQARSDEPQVRQTPFQKTNGTVQCPPAATIETLSSSVVKTMI